MQLFRVSRLRLRLVADEVDGVRIEDAEVPAVLRQRPPQDDGAGASLLQRGVVQESVGLRVDHFVGEGRGLGGVAGVIR